MDLPSGEDIIGPQYSGNVTYTICVRNENHEPIFEFPDPNDGSFFSVPEVEILLPI